MLLLPPNEFELIPATRSSEAPPTVKYSKLSPTKYSVSLHSSDRSFLVFQNTYSRDWSLEIEGLSQKPMPGNFVTNVFPISGTYSGEAEITFRGEKVQFWALRISLIGFILSIYLIFRTQINRYLILLSKRLRTRILNFIRQQRVGSESS